MVLKKSYPDMEAIQNVIRVKHPLYQGMKEIPQINLNQNIKF